MLQRRNLGAGILAAAALLCALLPASGQAQTPGLLSPQIVTGPSWIIQSIGGMSIAHDGSGGIVFLQNVNGVAHVFVSRFEHGVFQPGQQLDPTLAGPAYQAQIAADSGGDLVVVFVENGALWATQADGPQAGFSQPQVLAPVASNPSLSINRFGDGYVAFTAPDGSGDDVDVESYSSSSGWAPASPETMNETPGDDAGTGSARPSMVAAQDGVGIVAWGENGHVYSRRVWGTATSVETEQLDPSNVDGDTELSAGDPEVAAGGNSAYVDISFGEKVSNPQITGGVQSRVLLSQLVAEDTEPAITIDGLGPTANDDAYTPSVSMSEFGSGFATNATAAAGQLIVTPLGTNGNPGAAIALADPGGPGSTGPYPALSSLGNTIAWQQSQGAGQPQITAAVEAAGGGWEPPFTVSDPAAGPTDAQDGLEVGADGVDDTIFAWMQDTASGPEIEYAQTLEPPGDSNPKAAVQYSDSATPTLTWPAAREYWGAVTYTITMDGTVIGQTQATSLVPSEPLADGPQTWTVTATNAAGEESLGSTGTVFVDTTKPKLTLHLSGTLRVGSTLTLQDVYSDPANPTEPGSSPSGVANVSVAWGGGSKPVTAKTLTKATHTYTRRGSFKLTVTVTDRAGNATAVTRELKIGSALKQSAASERRRNRRTPKADG